VAVQRVGVKLGRLDGIDAIFLVLCCEIPV